MWVVLCRPRYFFDYGKPAGSQAWLDIVNKHVINGAADGIYIDCATDVRVCVRSHFFWSRVRLNF